MDQTSGPNEKPLDETEERVIRGAEAIAEFIFGDRSHRRKVYYLAECSKIPIHRLGSTLSGRRLTKAGSKVRNIGTSRDDERQARSVDQGSRAGVARLFSPSLIQPCENL
jgi:hypothetical protein